MNESPGPVSEILQAARRGEPGAEKRLFALVYDELRRMAGAKMAGLKAGLTLQPTALVHEAYLRLTGEGGAGWESRGHFFAAAAEAMRRILIDGYRRRQAAKRGGGWRRAGGPEKEVAATDSEVDLLALDEALARLEAIDARKVHVVKYRFFLGLSVAETAELLDVSTRTVEADWELAKAWLHGEIGEP